MTKWRHQFIRVFIITYRIVMNAMPVCVCASSRVCSLFAYVPDIYLAVCAQCVYGAHTIEFHRNRK